MFWGLSACDCVFTTCQTTNKPTQTHTKTNKNFQSRFASLNQRRPLRRKKKLCVIKTPLHGAQQTHTFTQICVIELYDPYMLVFICTLGILLYVHHVACDSCAHSFTLFRRKVQSLFRVIVVLVVSRTQPQTHSKTVAHLFAVAAAAAAHVFTYSGTKSGGTDDCVTVVSSCHSYRHNTQRARFGYSRTVKRAIMHKRAVYAKHNLVPPEHHQHHYSTVDPWYNATHTYAIRKW